RRLADLGQGDRHTQHIGMHLHPRAAPAHASAGDDLVDLVPGCSDHPADVLGAVADAFLNGPVHVLRTVVQAQPPDHPAGLTVAVRGAVALEVLVDHHTVSSWGQRTGTFGQQVVGVGAGTIGLGDDVAGEVVLEPLQHRAGGGLPTLHRVGAR